MSIDHNTAKRIAGLARIKTSENELDHIADELNKVFAMIDQLQEVNIADVEPLTSVLPMNAPMREDVITDGDRVQDILANAPLAREGFFAVPKVVE